MQNSQTDKPVIAYAIGGNLYLNITDRCTLRCRFCPKYSDSFPAGSRQVRDYDLSLPRRPEVREILRAIDARGDIAQFNEVVFCGYGEPTLRLQSLLAVARHVKAKGAKIRLNTDGLANRVHKQNVLPLLGESIDAVSVSMNAQNEPVYNRHCRPQLPGSYQAMLDFLQQAPNYIPDVTATAIEGLEGVDIPQCAAIAGDLAVNFRRRVLNVVG